jgi:hypothetical protein
LYTHPARERRRAAHRRNHGEAEDRERHGTLRGARRFLV